MPDPAALGTATKRLEASQVADPRRSQSGLGNGCRDVGLDGCHCLCGVGQQQEQQQQQPSDGEPVQLVLSDGTAELHRGITRGRAALEPRLESPYGKIR